MSMILDPDLLEVLAAAGIQIVGSYAVGSGTLAKYTSFSLSGVLTGGIASSPSAGDFVLIVVGTQGTTDLSNRAITDGAASAYTQHSLRYVNGVRDSNLTISYKFMGGTPNLTVNIADPPSGENGSAIILVLRGVNTSTPFDVADTVYSLTNGITTNPAAITPITSGALVLVAAFSCSTVSGGYSVNFASSDLTLIHNPTSSPNTVGDTAIGYVPWVSGAVDPAAFTGTTGSTNSTASAVTMAIRPAP